MKLKIISNGTRAGTTLVNAETGEVIEDVIGIHWTLSMRDEEWYGSHGGILSCIVEFADVAIEADGEIPQTLEEYKAMLAPSKK